MTRYASIVSTGRYLPEIEVSNDELRARYREAAVFVFLSEYEGEEVCVKIHPTAVIHPKAVLADDVEVGAYSVVGEHVTIGAGTRVLLDYHLNLLAIPQSSIEGYQQEEYTHLGVAAAVASGRADCGLGIAAAAQALDLDFVPLFQERYDLVIPKQFSDDDLLAPLFDLLADSDFRKAVSQLTGYDVSVMGTIILED